MNGADLCVLNYLPAPPLVCSELSRLLSATEQLRK